MKARIDTFDGTRREGNSFIIEEVKFWEFEIMPLQGDAIITHYGGNGRFKFKLDGIEYITTFTPDICCNVNNGGFHKDTDGYFDYSKVVFNEDPKQGWRDKYKSTDTYWIEA